MIRIRLARHGTKNSPFYRVVAIDKSRKNKGEPLEILGYWNPRNNLKKINSKKISEWTDKGAVVSNAVEKLIK